MECAKIVRGGVLFDHHCVFRKSFLLIFNLINIFSLLASSVVFIQRSSKMSSHRADGIEELPNHPILPNNDCYVKQQF